MAPMTPDRIAEIREKLREAYEMSTGGGAHAMNFYEGDYCQDITDLLTALSTAHAEGWRRGIEAAIVVVNDGLCRSRTFADTNKRLRQLLHEAP